VVEILNPTEIPPLEELLEIFYDEARLFTGYVYDTEMLYSIVPGLDVLRLSGETYLGRAGRAEVTLDAATNENIIDLATAAAATVGLDVEQTSTNLVASHLAYQGNLLTYLQRLQTTGFGLLTDGRDTLRVITRDVGPYPQRGSGFTDENPTADNVVYSGLRFGSKQESLITLVRVEPNADGVDPAESGTGYRALLLQTFSPSDIDAQALADYVLDIYSDSTPGPREITVDVAAQTNDTWARILNLDTYPDESSQARGAINQKQHVTFRSETYPMVIEGFSLTATPDSARVTYRFSPAPNFPYLILDDTDFGLLDTAFLGLG
jgi:hypothetical protein